MDRGSLEDLFEFSKKTGTPIPENVLCAITYQVTRAWLPPKLMSPLMFV